MNLLYTGLLSISLTIIFTVLEKKTKFKNLRKVYKDLIIGTAFGISASIATLYGTNISGATMNVRDAGPLCAGFFFSPEAGILAGLIGGIHRWFAIYFGAGKYTRLACTIATISAGFISAFVKKYLFDYKRPDVLYGGACATLIEIFHMLMVFLTNLNDAAYAYVVMVNCFWPMIIFNTAVIVLAILILDLMDKLHSGEKKKDKSKPLTITDAFRMALSICISISALLACLLIMQIQTNFAELTASSLLTTSLNDIKREIEIDKDATNKLTEYRHIGETGSVTIFDREGNAANRLNDVKNEYLKKIDIDDLTSKLAELKVSKKYMYGEYYYFMYTTSKDNYIVAFIPESEILASRNMTGYVVVITVLVVFSLLFILVFMLVKILIVKNIYKINTALGKIINGDLNTLVEVRSQLEFDALSNDINKTVSTLKDLIKKEEMRMAKDLEQATIIQTSSLPRNYPKLSNVKMYATTVPAKEVGGDFYDFYMIDSNHLAILIADVSGKGIPAALFMMQAKGIIKSFVETKIPLNEAMEHANNELCTQNDADMFVTVWMGILDITTGKLQYVNAGHGSPCVYRKGIEFDFLNSKTNFIVAGMKDVKYDIQEAVLAKSDQLYLFTDGVAEATSDKTELFGNDRIKSSLNKVINSNPEEQCKNILSDIKTFIHGADQFDDITMLMLHYV